MRCARRPQRGADKFLQERGEKYIYSSLLSVAGFFPTYFNTAFVGWPQEERLSVAVEFLELPLEVFRVAQQEPLLLAITAVRLREGGAAEAGN